MLPAEFLAMLCCPKTGSKLACLTPSAIDFFNEQIIDGGVSNVLGQALTEPLEGLLTNADQSYGYPIRNGTPDMVEGEAIELSDYETFEIEDSDSHE